MRTSIVVGAIAAALAAATVPAGATISFFDAQMPQPSEQNVDFEAAQMTPQLTHTGDTNKSGSPVIFDTNFAKAAGSLGGAGTGQLFQADGLGQGNLICSASAPGNSCPNVAGGLAHLLTSMEMKPGPGFAWTDAILNTQSGTGTVNIFVTDQMGGQFQDTLKKGQNFVTIVAGVDPTTKVQEVITDIQVTELATATGPFGFEQFKQPRVSGVCTIPTGSTTCTPIPVPTPEPTSLMLLGAGLVGLGLVRRRIRS